MPAYMIAEVSVTDQEKFGRYREQIGSTLQKHRAKPVGVGPPIPLEGDWDATVLVVYEFADAEAARRWYGSPEYAAARELRRGAARVRIAVVERR